MRKHLTLSDRAIIEKYLVQDNYLYIFALHYHVAFAQPQNYSIFSITGSFAEMTSITWSHAYIPKCFPTPGQE